MERNGGRPKKETTGFENKKTTGYSQKKPNVNVNVNVNENENVNANVNENVGDSCVDGLQDIIAFYEDNITAITPFSADILYDFLKEMGKDLVILAMQKAVQANIRTIQYIKGILNNWSKKGIKTVLQAKEEDQKYKNKNIPLQETKEEEMARRIKEIEEAQKNDGS